MERRYKDGSTITQIGDDCTRYVAPNGSEEWSYPDGIVVCLTENKEQIIRFPNGQVEIHGADHKVINNLLLNLIYEYQNCTIFRDANILMVLLNICTTTE